MALLRIGAFLVLSTAFAQNAAAGTVHEVRFSQSAQVLVWADGIKVGQGPAVALGAGPQQATSMIGAGTLDPIQDLSDRMILEIASNTGFVIEAPHADGSDAISVRVINQGANAQVRQGQIHAGSSRLFEQVGRTAIRPGAPRTQTLTLELTSDENTLDHLIIRAVGE
ncbi:MAG: hypothetical protein ACE37M_08950 [Henriciella sp.]